MTLVPAIRNLHNLYSLKCRPLKIDKSFVDTLTTNSASHLIVEHIIEMAQASAAKNHCGGLKRPNRLAGCQKRGVQYAQMALCEGVTTAGIHLPGLV